MDLEARFAELVTLAKEIDCDLDLSLVIGGQRDKEIYRIKRIVRADGTKSETLSDQLDDIERLLDDDRTAAAAKATKRMVLAEDTLELAIAHAKARQTEFSVAAKAFESISTDLPIDDLTSGVIAALVDLVDEDPKQPEQPEQS